MPRLLDLFCGAGGAAMGYSHAGFEIVGVDIGTQKHYPFAFIQADALDVLYALARGEGWTDLSGRDWHLEDFDAIHASPPCQYYTRLRHLPWLRDKSYWRSIPPTRTALQATGLPYIIENVQDAYWDMETPAYICGYSLGLQILRHRCFETWPFSVLQPGHRKHDKVIVSGGVSLSQRHHGGQGFKAINRSSIAGKGNYVGDTERWRLNTGIDWMTGAELAQAIPPVYCEFIGKQLLQALRTKEAQLYGGEALPLGR